ncbi:MAG: endonuclease III [Oscillospiraceae bacterium]|nr:endonuclease III [Oscillospiraceae bacterium]
MRYIDEIIRLLEEEYPAALCSLEYEVDWQLLFSVRLSAQCTDERVNLVTPALFARFPTLEAFAEAKVEEVEELIHSCGFYHGKARDLIGSAQMLLRDYGGVVPDSMEELLKLPGVGRKTANLILGDVYHKPSVVTDTHCIRLSRRMGLTVEKEPVKVERDLRAILPPEKSSDFCHRMVLHGRKYCTARKPDCGACPLTGICKKIL